MCFSYLTYRFKTYLALLLLCLAGTQSNQALAADCQLPAGAAEASALAYQDRGNRCEGIYRQKVSGRVNLRIVGYHANRVKIDNSSDEWVIQMQAHAEQATQLPLLQVVSLRANDYFQMDTTQLNEDGIFRWQTDLLSGLDYPPQARDLAALACSPSCSLREQSKQNLFPVSFGSEPYTSTEPVVLVYVMADVELQSLLATLTPLDSAEPLFANRPVGRKFLPARRAQRLLIKELGNKPATLRLIAETHGGRRAFVEADLWPTKSAQ